MTRQELYAWSSIGITLSVFIFYVLIAFGWPEGIPDYSSQTTRIFFNVFWIAFVIEFILGITEKKGQVTKDERDQMIESKGFRNAYHFLSLCIAVLIIQVLLSYVFADITLWHAKIAEPSFTLHALFVLLLLSSMVRRGTQLYYYRRGE